MTWEEARSEKKREAGKSGRSGKKGETGTREEDVLPIEWLREGPDSVGLVDGSAWSQMAV